MISMLPIILSALTFFSTLLGGYVALKSVKWIKYVLGYTAGVLLGVVSFDLLPEIFEHVSEGNIDIMLPMVALALGFLLFHILERSILIHHGDENQYGAHTHPHVGVASALALLGHSLLDGIAIGIGFQAGVEVGIAVSIAIIAHKFSDGLNTVVLLLRHKNKQKRAIQFLVLVAIAPIVGVLSTLFFTVSDTILVAYLGFFAGFLLYIGASDILPQAHAKGSSWKTIGFTIFGLVSIYFITQFAHIH